MLVGVDAFYDRAIEVYRFSAKMVSLTPKSSENTPHLFFTTLVLATRQKWDFFFPVHEQFYFFSQKQFLGDVLSSQIEEHLGKKKMVGTTLS